MDDIRDIDSMSPFLGALSSNASLLHKLLLLICLSVPLSCWLIRRAQSTLIRLELVTKDLERLYSKYFTCVHRRRKRSLPPIVDHVLLLRYVATV